MYLRTHLKIELVPGSLMEGCVRQQHLNIKTALRPFPKWFVFNLSLTQVGKRESQNCWAGRCIWIDVVLCYLSCKVTLLSPRHTCPGILNLLQKPFYRFFHLFNCQCCLSTQVIGQDRIGSPEYNPTPHSSLWNFVLQEMHMTSSAKASKYISFYLDFQREMKI